MIIPRRRNGTDDPVPGWDHTTTPDDDNANLWCPNGHCSGVPHSIMADGTVIPSVVCPREGCGFHENVVLQDWDGGFLKGKGMH